MSSPPPVTLVLEDGQGNQEAHVLSGPGGTIRISVGEPGCHAAVWKIWAGPKKCDVYVAVRSIGGYQKVSLHESGDWRFQWVAEDHAQKYAQTTDRVIDQWRQPSEMGESGWTKGFSMWARHQDVVRIPDNESLPADLLWVPPPPEGYAMGLHVVIARPEDLSQRSASELRWVELKGPSFPFDGFTLADGRVVLMIVSRDLVTDAVNHMIDDALAKAESALGGADQARILLQGAGSPRMLVWANGSDGDRQAWDVVVQLPASAAEQDDAPA